MKSTYIKLDRNIMKWGWYTNATTFRVFLHLLLNANIKDSFFEHIPVKRGQLVTSYNSLVNSLQISYQQGRTAISHLKSTGEITVSQNPKSLLVTVINYDKYQGATESLTGNQQANNRQINNNQRNNKEYIYNKKNINIFFTSAENRARTKKIIDTVNRVTGKKFMPEAETNLKLIARLTEQGYTEDDILSVVHKADECWSDTEYKKFITPSNLFGKRFDSFLNGGIFPPGSGSVKETPAHSYSRHDSIDFDVFVDIDSLEDETVTEQMAGAAL